MLISIESSQGCGKTTLINELKKIGYNVVERKTSRSLLSDWGLTLDEVNNNPALTLEFQDEIIKRKFADEKEHLKSDEVVFTERSYAAPFVYGLICLGRLNQYSDWMDQYYDECKVLQRQYAAVVYLTGGHFKIENDGVRGTNKHYGNMVDIMLYETVQQMTKEEKTWVIDYPSLRVRVEAVNSFVDMCKKESRKK